MSAETYTIQVSLKSSVVEAIAAANSVVYTDPAGDTFATDPAGKLRAANIPAGSSAYGSYTPTADDFDVAYYNAAGTALLTGDALVNAKSNLTTTGASYAVYATGDTVTRVSLHYPGETKDAGSYTFAEAFTNVSLTVQIASVTWTNSEPVFSGFSTLYWSVSGNTDNSTPTEIGSAPLNNNTSGGAINISIEAK